MEDDCLVQLPKPIKFIWIIKNFSKLNADEDGGIDSDFFSVGGCQWYLSIYPKGDTDSDHNHISLYLHCHEDDSVEFLPYAQFSLAIVDQFNDIGRKVRKDFECQFTDEWGWGESNFMPITKLNDPDGGYLMNDTCIVEVQIAAACTTMMKISTDDDVSNSVVSSRKQKEEGTQTALPKLQIADSPRNHNVVALDSEKYTEVGGFGVLKTHASLYKQIWSKHGHIVSSQDTTAITYISQVYLVTDIMNFVADMNSQRFPDVTDAMIDLWDDKIKMAENLDFDVKWLRKRFEDIKKCYHVMKNSETDLFTRCIPPLLAAKVKVKKIEDELRMSKVNLAAAKNELRECFPHFSEKDVEIYASQNLLFEETCE